MFALLGEFGSSLYFIINGTVAVEVSTSERGCPIKQVCFQNLSMQSSL